MAKKYNKKAAEVVVTVSAKKADWAKAQDSAFEKLSKKLQVKGFRKGQAPKAVAKKNISETDIFSDAIKIELENLVKIAANELKDEMVLEAPSYKISKLTKDVLEVDFVYPVYPEFELNDYKNLGIKFKAPKIDDKTVDEEINNLLEKRALLVPKKEQVIAKNDFVVFDFEGSVDGKLFDGGAAKDFELTIGSGQFIPGFEDQMIGLKAQEEKELKIKFPDDYHSEDLKGKDTVFKVKINEIKIKEVPKLDETFIKDLKLEDKKIKTPDQLKTYYKDILEKEAAHQEKLKFMRLAFDKIKENVEIPVPASLVAKEMKNIAEIFAKQIEKQGMNVKQYMEMTGLKEEQMLSQYKSQAEIKLRDSLIFAEIAKKEKIEIKDDEYEKEYKKLAKVYGQSEDAIKGTITKEQMQIPMINDRVLELLIVSNK